MNIIWVIGIIAAAIVAIIVFLVATIKVARSDQALVVTGMGATKKTVQEGKTMYEPTVKIAGSKFVIPFVQKHKFFDLCVETITAEKDEILTKDGVPILVDWVAQIHPNAESTESLQPALKLFLEKSKEEIKNTIKDILDGGVRAVVSTMKPIEVMVGKDELDDKVKASIGKSLGELGYCVELSIRDVTDDKGYFDNIAAQDRETKRQEAENIKAAAEQSIREKKAETNKTATEKELDTELSIAEKQRNNSVKQSEFKIEMDTKEADAEIAKELQTTTRQKEVAKEKGQITVEEQKQANLAAVEEKNVIKTQAEAQKEKKMIEATAEAEAVKTTAAGKAEAIKIEAEAEANKTEKVGNAEATVISAKGKAEADAIREKGLAEAEAELKLGEARAANDKVNFEVTKLEIETKARVEIATKMGSAMAEFGKNAKFVDFGNGNPDGDLVTRTVMNLPKLFEQLDLTNKSIRSDGQGFNDTLGSLIGTVADAIRGDDNTEPSDIKPDNNKPSKR